MRLQLNALIKIGVWISKVAMTYINYNWSNCLLKKVYFRYIFILEDALSVCTNLIGPTIAVRLVNSSIA